MGHDQPLSVPEAHKPWTRQGTDSGTHKPALRQSIDLAAGHNPARSRHNAMHKGRLGHDQPVTVSEEHRPEPRQGTDSGAHKPAKRQSTDLAAGHNALDVAHPQPNRPKSGTGPIPGVMRLLPKTGRNPPKHARRAWWPNVSSPRGGGRERAGKGRVPLGRNPTACRPGI